MIFFRVAQAKLHGLGPKGVHLFDFGSAIKLVGARVSGPLLFVGPLRHPWFPDSRLLGWIRRYRPCLPLVPWIFLLSATRGLSAPRTRGIPSRSSSSLFE